MNMSEYKEGKHNIMYLKAKTSGIVNRLKIAWYVLTFKSYAFTYFNNKIGTASGDIDITAKRIQEPLMIIDSLNDMKDKLVNDIADNIPRDSVERVIETSNMTHETKNRIKELVYGDE